MVAILEMPEVRERVSRLSVEEYHRLNEHNENGRRTELLRGIVIEKMSKLPLHATLAKRLYDRIIQLVGSGWIVRREDPLQLSDSVPEPDLAVVAGVEADFLKVHPATAELVIEVAVSNPELDRANASLHAEAGVKEYWIVLGSERRVEVYRRPSREGYQITFSLGPEDLLACASVPAVSIPAQDLFAGL